MFLRRTGVDFAGGIDCKIDRKDLDANYMLNLNKARN